MNAVDTNVLIYARDPRDPRKKAIATSLIASLRDGTLLWQVACEYVNASRKLVPHGFDHAQAYEDIRKLRRTWKVVTPDWGVFGEAGRLFMRYSLSIWDALLIAACLVGRVERLYSEDFDAYGRIDALEIVNPFR
jgi:predicted nucleic acid-binding protein